MVAVCQGGFGTAGRLVRVSQPRSVQLLVHIACDIIEKERGISVAYFDARQMGLQIIELLQNEPALTEHEILKAVIASYE